MSLLSSAKKSVYEPITSKYTYNGSVNTNSYNRSGLTSNKAKEEATAFVNYGYMSGKKPSQTEDIEKSSSYSSTFDEYLLSSKSSKYYSVSNNKSDSNSESGVSIYKKLV